MAKVKDSLVRPPLPAGCPGRHAPAPLPDRRLRRAPQSNVGSSFLIGGFLIWACALCDLSTSSRADPSRSRGSSRSGGTCDKESHDLSASRWANRKGPNALSAASRADLSRSWDSSGLAKADRKESYDLRSHNSHILRLQNGHITGLQNGHILRLQHAFYYALQNDHILRSEHGHIPMLQALPRSEMRRPIELLRDPSRRRAILHLR